MTESVSTPGPAAPRGPGRPPEQAGQSCQAAGALSGDDLLALLDSLGVSHSTADFGDDEEAVLADLFSVRPDQPDEPRSLGDDHGGREAGPAASQSNTASPAWIAGHLPAGPGLAAVLAQDARQTRADRPAAGNATHIHEPPPSRA